MDADRTLQALLRSLEETTRAELSAEAFSAALGAAAGALDVHRAWIQRNDADGPPRIACSIGAPPACLEAATHGLPWPSGVPAKPPPAMLVIEAAAAAPGTLPAALRADGLAAATYVPVVAGGRLLGALVLLTGTRREWTAAEQAVAGGLAHLAAGVFERDRERSARHRLERELVRAQRLESVGRIAGSVAHDFNNLLTAMIGYMDLVSSGLPPDAEEQGYIAQALDAAEQATELSRRTLAFARRQPAPPAPQDLNALLDHAESLVRRIVPDSVQLVASAHGESVWVMADAGQVELALVNLALHASDAMPEGGVLTLSVTRAPDASGGPGWGVLEVADSSEGMDPDTLRRALKPFGVTVDDGRGLELAITSALVNASGGRMEAESGPGLGTRVRVLLPLVQPQGARQDAGAVTGGSESVLVVDDDRAMRELETTMLSRLGYEVLAATDADDALRCLERNPAGVRLLIADLVLPGMSGRELALRAREAHPGLRVLLTSGYASPPGEPETAGGLPFLPKPFSRDALARRVRETLDAPPAGTGGAPD